MHVYSWAIVFLIVLITTPRMMNAQPRGIRQLPAYMERPYHLVYYLAPGFFFYYVFFYGYSAHIKITNFTDFMEVSAMLSIFYSQHWNELQKKPGTIKTTTTTTDMEGKKCALSNDCSNGKQTIIHLHKIFT